MTDVHDKATRSYNMSRIRAKDTRPEIVVRKFLHARGFRYRLHDKKLPGKPDIVLPKYKIIVDVRGCFWHGHKECKWGDKVKSESIKIMGRVKSAVERDKINEAKWHQLGWNTIIVWDTCELETKKKNSDKRRRTLSKVLRQLKRISQQKHRRKRLTKKNLTV